MPTPNRPRHSYAVSEIAMALATKQSAGKSTKVTHTNANARGIVQTTVEVTDPDPEVAWRTSALLLERSLEQFGDPREAAK